MAEPHSPESAMEAENPSRVREKILSDHVRLRKQLDPIEGLAKQVIAGDDAAVKRLRQEAERFHAALARHMSWEDEHLAPTLREIDAWGEERARRLAVEHREQRERLSRFLEKLHDPKRAKQHVARDLLELGAWLRRDMDEEEATTLDPNVVRDDVIGIDVETG
jgi:hemerythrin-like domain-containing protein